MKMCTDIVERLRAPIHYHQRVTDHRLQQEAADEIVKLREQLVHLIPVLPCDPEADGIVDAMMKRLGLDKIEYIEE
jgi:hypothetical protein